MNLRILSDKEREILTEYLATGKRNSGAFRMLKFRILRNFDKIMQDYELLHKARDAFKT